MDAFLFILANFFSAILAFLSIGAGWGRVGRGLKMYFFVQQMSGNNWGPFFSPGDVPVKRYFRLTAKNGRTELPFRKI